MPSSAVSDHVVLVGMMGSGKTTVGRLVAERLGRPFRDSDEEIEARTGKTVAEIFATEGEPAFRALESQMLVDALAHHAPSVIAAAGGVVLDADNRRRLRDAFVVWLRADPAVLAVRVADSGHRPLLADDPEATLRRLHGDRLALYAEVADGTVDVDGRTVAEVADEVVRLLP